jgi:hypothetical protein
MFLVRECAHVACCKAFGRRGHQVGLQPLDGSPARSNLDRYYNEKGRPKMAYLLVEIATTAAPTNTTTDASNVTMPASHANSAMTLPLRTSP